MEVIRLKDIASMDSLNLSANDIPDFASKQIGPKHCSEYHAAYRANPAAPSCSLHAATAGFALKGWFNIPHSSQVPVTLLDSTTNMAQPHEHSLMGRQYLEAEVQLEGSRTKCAEIARLNLTDPNLSRYYRMKNLLLVVTAEDDWHGRERARRHIETIWRTASDLTKDDEHAAKATLAEIRETLEQVVKDLEAAAPARVDEERLKLDCDDEDDVASVISETEAFGDDEASVRAVEKELFGDDGNIIAMYERAAQAGQAARLQREKAAIAAEAGGHEEAKDVGR